MVCTVVTGCEFLYQMKVGLLLRMQVVLQVSVTLSPSVTTAGVTCTRRPGEVRVNLDYLNVTQPDLVNINKL